MKYDYIELKCNDKKDFGFEPYFYIFIHYKNIELCMTADLYTYICI